MQRRQILKGIAGLALAERLGALQAAWAAGNKLPPPGMHRITGDVRINGQPASPGSPVKPGDTVSTGPNSQAIYIIGNDAYLQRDRSTVSLAGQQVRAGLRVVSGKLLAVFGKGDKQIDTPTATIGIRGTGCYIEAEAHKVYFCLCYGKAEISSAKMPNIREILETSYHDKPVYLHADGSQMMVPATVVNHTDSELTLLESLVGRTPPFYGKGGAY